jgi:NAD-reducing hydrogenase small subunit
LHATPITDLKHPPVGGVDVGVLEGCVNHSAGARVARQMRARCKVLVALGDCAVFGGVPTMRNGVGMREALRRAYIETESTAEGRVPSDPELATMQDARALDQVVPVDVYLPGCPPAPDTIFHALAELAAGRKPELTGKRLDWH